MNLVQVNNGQVVVSSRDIAEHFEKQHKNVIQGIENLKAENSALTSMFYETSYTAGTGKAYKEYLMTKDGFSLLVMGFTGAKALDWKLKYIAAFNAMEAALKKKTLPADTAKSERLAIMKQNAKVREAKLWEKLSQEGNDTFKQVCRTYAANTLAGKQILALPEVQERTYTATEIAEVLGITAHKLGRLANLHDMKVEKYGKWYHDKSRYSSKEVEVFRYYENAIPAFRELLKGGEA